MSRVRGLGAAHTGTKDFWHQRITSVAAIPLTIVVIIIVVSLLGRNHAAVVQILSSPLVAIIMLVSVGMLFWLGARAFHDMYQNPWVDIHISHLVRTFHT